jgi:hypothetical protein
MNYIYIMKDEKKQDRIITVIIIIWFVAVATLATIFG